MDFNQPFSSSRVRMTFVFDIDQDFADRAGVGSVIASVPFLQRASTTEGYALAISGTMGNLGEPQPLGGSRGRR